MIAQTAPETQPDVTATLVKAIETVWSAIRGQHPEVPAVVVTLGAGSGNRGGLKLGHYAPERWEVAGEAEARPELFIGGEGLERGAEGVLATALHEAAHSIATARGIQDTSRQGRWHNARFKEIAEELGLEVSKHDRIGWSLTKLAEGTADRYRSVLDSLDAALVAFRRAEVPAAAGSKPSNFKPALCGCGRRIRVTRSILETAPITCGACGEDFAIDDE